MALTYACFPSIIAIEAIGCYLRVAILNNYDTTLSHRLFRCSFEVTGTRYELREHFPPQNNLVQIRLAKLSDQVNNFLSNASLRHALFEVSCSSH